MHASLHPGAVKDEQGAGRHPEEEPWKVMLQWAGMRGFGPSLGSLRVGPPVCVPLPRSACLSVGPEEQRGAFNSPKLGSCC